MKPPAKTEVFNRHEKKYVLTHEQYEMISCELREYMNPDIYAGSDGMYQVNTLYYDTPQNELIHTSLLKPQYREKLRLRSYGAPELDAPVYVEIKKKAAGFGNKRRSSMLLRDAYRFLETGILPELEPYMNVQVLREVQYILQRYSLALRPALSLCYDRAAFHGIDQSDLRISFDTNLRARRSHPRLEDDTPGRLLTDSDTVIMEVKVLSSIPVWLAGMLSRYRLYQCSFSKYGTVYTQELQKKKEEREMIV